MNINNELFGMVIEELNALMGCEHIPTHTIVKGMTIVEHNKKATVTLFTNHGSFEINLIDELTKIRVEQLYLNIDSSYSKAESFEDVMDGVLTDISAVFKSKNRLNNTYKKHGFFKK